MKIYLAARYQQRDELKIYAEDLRKLGYEVTSRWLEEPENETAIPSEEERRAKYAQYDYEDVKLADMLILFSVSEDTRFLRGGKDVEFGMAVAWNKRIIVVGPKQNIFHYLPDRMIHLGCWSECLVVLKTCIYFLNYQL